MDYSNWDYSFSLSSLLFFSNFFQVGIELETDNWLSAPTHNYNIITLSDNIFPQTTATLSFSILDSIGYSGDSVQGLVLWNENDFFANFGLVFLEKRKFSSFDLVLVLVDSSNNKFVFLIGNVTLEVEVGAPLIGETVVGIASTTQNGTFSDGLVSFFLKSFF